ncbi:MAG: discoidin domain-containing protein [Bryobacteraceae bacterium]
MPRVAILIFMVVCALNAQQHTLGVGVYPGNPSENFAPLLRVDRTTYRNLALHRPAYHSSSYDYNLTAQLITDGIKETKLPRWVSVSTSQDGVLKKNEREWLLDHNWVTSVTLKGPRGWIQLELDGGDGPPEVDRIDLQGAARGPARAWSCAVSGSDNGQDWQELGRTAGADAPGRDFKTSVPFTAPARKRFYRAQIESEGATAWEVGEVTPFHHDRRIEVSGPFHFTSAWMSGGNPEEWVYADLGTPCTFDRVVLSWIRRAGSVALQVSDDAVNWKTLRPLPGDQLAVVNSEQPPADDIRIEPTQARYVRVSMQSTAAGIILSEMEVYGRGGPVPEAKPMPPARANGRQDLAGGSWRLQRDSLVTAGGEALSKPGFADRDWIVATVPGTVLTSYYNIGAVPDPNFGDNQLMISDSFFYADFWYRNEFTTPAVPAGKHTWLNFAGINWKADVFLNGEKLGRIEGGFMRGQFDITSRLHAGQKNALAVRVEKNATPGSVKEKTFLNPDKNGGALGADNPTFHASIGWDWIPSIRGRNMGIWNDVYLTTTGPVTVEDPLVTTKLPLPDTSQADVTIEVLLRNHDSQPVTGSLKGTFGDAGNFTQDVSIEAGQSQNVKQVIHIRSPKLWWPAGYGDPHLYNVQLTFETAGHAASDSRSFQAGVRQFTYSEDGGALRMWINGRRFIPRGGNWGFSESMLRYRAREYDAAVRYHRDMHFTMIRNWVGQLGEDAFYDACDRYGVVVWQDFWLANPYDGPDPDDNDLFLRNARDTVLRIRSHPSLGLYVGRNEGYPPKPLEDGIRQALGELHPDLHYISSSADDVVSGHGPYRAMPLKTYFSERATPKFHSEMGMPNIVNLDSLRAMMPESEMWPQGRMWGIHDFSLEGAQGGASFRERIEKSYGGANNAAEWVSLAQFVNYEGYRAMFEAQSKNRMGLLIWMSHPTWPSFVWQTYDYYLEPTAAYFGAKKASEPLHIQWNPVTESVEVVNYSGGNATGLTAQAEVLNMDGVAKWQKTAQLDSAEDSTAAPIHMEYPERLTPVHFIRLKLSRGPDTISENFYWRGLEDANFRAIRDLPKVSVEAKTRAQRQGDRWLLTTALRNTSQQPALMVRVKAVREKAGDRILPALYTDNYVCLMPGERRTLQIEMSAADARGEKPRVIVDGFNVK